MRSPGSRRPDSGEAFVHDFGSRGRAIRDGDSEAFGRVFVWAAISNDAISELARDEVFAEEMDGILIDDADEALDEPELD